MIDRRVLILNSNYEPLGVCSVKRAMIMMVCGKAEMVDTYPGEYLRSVRMRYPVPSILRLHYFVNIHRKEIPLNKENILRRDDYTCQYCGKKGKRMTVDHVIPKTRGGKDTWENLVCACEDCNVKKGNRTPEEAGMKLLRKPRKPYYTYFVIKSLGAIPKNWQPYIYYILK